MACGPIWATPATVPPEPADLRPRRISRCVANRGKVAGGGSAAAASREVKTFDAPEGDGVVGGLLVRTGVVEDAAASGEEPADGGVVAAQGCRAALP
ncbi:hypothetical protein BCL76_12615 [Streptomyces sp. CG 926]|nr:hypothetical protein BCL76_12615 [Streptomyces sp. CG 926]